MEAGIKAGTGSREFRLSCPASSSHIDVVYPQHVARGIEEEERNLHHEEVAPRPGSYQLSRLPALLLSRGMNIPSSLIDAEISRPPIDHRLSYRVRRELILNGITWTMAGWIKIQKIWKFHRQDYPLKVKKLLEFEREREIGRIFILEKHFNRYKLSCVIQSFKSFSNCSISSRRNIFSLIFRINAIKILSGKRKK